MTERTPLIQKAIWLSWFTIFYNLAEGIISIWLGVSEGSVSLAGFGVDSLIEVGSAMLVLWRFRGETGRGKALILSRERRATLGIGILFLGLAAVSAFASIVQLLHRSHPETTVPGLVISALSLSFMVYLWRAKKRVAVALDSATMANDANCSMACIKLSVVLFAGSLLFLIAPALWWTDAIAALILSGFIGKEGWETIQATRKENFSGCCGCK